MILNRAVIVFVLFLIISITPVTAAQINSTVNQTQSAEQIQDNFEKNEKKMEDAMSSMKADNDDFNNAMDKIDASQETIDECLNFIRDNWWKFWMWWEVGQKFSRMLSEAAELENFSHDVENTAKKLEDKSKDMEKAASNFQDENQTTDEGSKQNAQKMVKELGRDLNISLSISSATNLKEGDIVQYKSQGKYYRYLQFGKIVNNSVLLTGSYKNITLPLKDFKEHTNLKLTSNSSLNSSKIVAQAYNIQKNEIDDNIALASNKKRDTENKIEELNEYGKKFADLYVQIFVRAVLLALLCIPAALMMIANVEFGLMVLAALGGAALIMMGISNIPLIICVICFKVAESLVNVVNEAKMELAAAEDDLNDLNNYGIGYVDDHSPVAGSMNLTTKMGKEINAILNATDPDNDVLNYTIITPPQYGTLNLTQNGSFVYTPSANYTGNDSFIYKANDGQFDSNIANVTITINPNSPPVAWDMNLTTEMGKEINEIFNATDPDGDMLSFIIVDQPRYGTLNLTQNGSFVYTPFANYIGTDSFTYKANDGFIDSNIANVSITISKLQSYFTNQQTKGLSRSVLINNGQLNS